MPKAMRAPLLLVVSILLTAPCWLPAAPAAAQQSPPNLLVNGDFEAWPAAGWPWQDGVPEVQISPGWRAFYVDTPPDWVTAPTYWKRPEFRDVKRAEYAYRVHGGYLAQKYFTFGGQHIAGLYQQVGGITPGTPLRFSIYMETWSCMAGAEWNICPTGAKSNSPSPMHTRVGIDPYGGTNPWSPNIIWSAETNAYDQWTLFSVDAVAQAGAVTVFTYSHADWFDSVFRMANDVYVDDGSLVVLAEMPAPAATEAPTSAPTATPDPSLPTATPTPTRTPAATPTARPDGAVVHIVQEGDTLGAIALQYGLTVDEILKLNGLADPNVVSVGQEIVIAVPEATTTPIAPTPMPTVALPTPTPAFTATPQPTATALPTTPTIIATSTVSAAAGVTVAPDPATTSAPSKGVSALWLVPILIGGAAIGFIAARRIPR